LDLAPNQYFWYDCNATNGFTYYYAVTTFDRGYRSGSSQQGLEKFDNCTVTKGQPFGCPSELVQLEMEVLPQNDLYKIYVVPNPYRSGGSRLTEQNYHNFPDELIRFVNVPGDCTIKIFTVSGDLVWENVQTNNGGNVEWDLKNRGSESVTSGVYIYRVERPDGDSVFGRIVVIR
ncbi:MAG TPA: T9SS type A sorting domain-containing protein, partial [Candidatus Krumholzibacteria bacterium]|nr:T9SS type A sorting domain-containing protein [Candidatus Krumholzibacteria bacterium]